MLLKNFLKTFSFVLSVFVICTVLYATYFYNVAINNFKIIPSFTVSSSLQQISKTLDLFDKKIKIENLKEKYTLEHNVGSDNKTRGRYIIEGLRTLPPIEGQNVLVEKIKSKNSDDHSILLREKHILNGFDFKTKMVKISWTNYLKDFKVNKGENVEKFLVAEYKKEKRREAKKVEVKTITVVEDSVSQRFSSPSKNTSNEMKKEEKRRNSAPKEMSTHGKETLFSASSNKVDQDESNDKNYFAEENQRIKDQKVINPMIEKGEVSIAVNDAIKRSKIEIDAKAKHRPAVIVSTQKKRAKIVKDVVSSQKSGQQRKIKMNTQPRSRVKPKKRPKNKTESTQVVSDDFSNKPSRDKLVAPDSNQETQQEVVINNIVTGNLFTPSLALPTNNQIDIPKPEEPVNDNNDKYNAISEVRGIGVDLLSKELSWLTEFEFETYLDIENKRYFDSNGLLKVKVNLAGKIGSVRGTIHKDNTFEKTLVIVNLENNKIQGIDVPVFKRDSFLNYLQNRELSEEGGFYLVEINEEVLDVEIDSDYSKIIFFDHKFNEVEETLEAKYLLFANTDIGNAFVTFKLQNKEIAEKIVYIGEKTITFDKVSFEEIGLKDFELAEKSILARELKGLSINGDQILSFDSKEKAKEISNSAYSMKFKPVPSGFRKYLDFYHLSDINFMSKVTMFVAFWENDLLELPGERFIFEVFDSFNIGKLNDRCMVHLNFSKEPQEVEVATDGKNGSFSFSEIYLDDDGIWGEEAIEKSVNGFILGEGEGVVDVYIEYVDKSQEYIQSYCYPNLYTVENL